VQRLQVQHLPGIYEPFSALSHLLGAALFLLLGLLLLRRGRGDGARLAFLGVYAASCVLLFCMSAAYHTVAASGAAQQVLVRLDHGAIFLLIAGSFTPAHGLLFRGPFRWMPLLLIWAAALGGVTLKVAYFYTVPEWLSLTFYLALGWVGVLSGSVLWARHGFGFIRPLLWGGIAYSVGAVVDFVRWPNPVPGVIHAHELFHVAVLVGALFHWSFVWQIADGHVPPVTPVRENGRMMRERR
jgi:channel protein (hemolysin III family)